MIEIITNKKKECVIIYFFAACLTLASICEKKLITTLSMREISNFSYELSTSRSKNSSVTVD